jgi:hypothetical protein
MSYPSLSGILICAGVRLIAARKHTAQAKISQDGFARE